MSLKARIARDGILLAPGIYDGLTASLPALQHSAEGLATLDVLVNLAERARALDLTCPSLS